MRSNRGCRLRVLVCSVIFGVAFCYVGSVNADFTFGHSTNLGPPVNTAYGEVGPSLSSDGLELYFSDYESEGRPGGHGGADLWVATRATTDDRWRTPTHLGPVVNGPAHDMEPSISADGLSLYFNSDRPGGYGGFDIWMARRATTDSAWGTPLNLGPAVNSTASETEPCVSADGLTLFFDSDRKGGLGDSDLYMTTRPTTDDSWGQPVNLGAPVNSPSLERGPSVSSDGLVLFFVSYRASEDSDLWMTTRVTISEPWPEPVSLQ